MFNLTIKEKIQSVILRAYRPSFAARERCKTVFLSAVKTSFSKTAFVSEKGTFKFRYFARGFVTAIALVALVGGVTTYADYADVGSENALYPLKRTSESVRLSLTGNENKPSLHLELANRRLKEMKTTTKEGRAEQLAQDFTNEIKQSIIVTVSTPAPTEVLPEISIPSTIITPSTVQTLQIEFNTEKSTLMDQEGGGAKDSTDAHNDNKENNSHKSDSKKSRIMAISNDPFCNQLKEMVSDPNPAVQAVTARDPFLRTLISERCEFDSFLGMPRLGSGGIQLATTSLPSLP